MSLVFLYIPWKLHIYLLIANFPIHDHIENILYEGEYSSLTI